MRVSRTTADPSSNMVLVKSNVIAQPIFLAFLGVSGVNLEANACAQSSSQDVMASYSGVKWLTPSAVYLSSLISSKDSFADSAVVPPLGNFYVGEFW